MSGIHPKTGIVTRLNGEILKMDNAVWKLNDNYEIRHMSAEDFDPLFRKHAAALFEENTQVFRPLSTLTSVEQDLIQKLKGNMGKPFELNLGVYHHNEFIGWHYGRQDGVTSFYMQNSGILPEHRRKGLYAQLLEKVITAAIEAGFLRIWSRHNATNNAVIIPKLKKGFVISALEVTESYGTLVHLSYLAKDIHRKVLDYRVGQIKPDKEIRDLLKI